MLNSCSHSNKCFTLLHSTDGYECDVCGKRYPLQRNLISHRKLSHSSSTVFTCRKCPFKTIFLFNFRRHQVLRHLRRRSSYVPRRSISIKKKEKAVEYWRTSNASTPEKRRHVEETFKLTPNTQSRLFAKKDAFVKAKKCLFRVEGGGRHTDEFWAPIEAKLLERFSAKRAMGCIVHKRHLLTYVFEICAELNVNLAEEGERRKWKSAPKVLRQRIDRFCLKHKIRMKRASRQLHKNPQVWKLPLIVRVAIIRGRGNTCSRSSNLRPNIIRFMLGFGRLKSSL